MGHLRRKKRACKLYNKNDSFVDKLLTVLFWPVRLFLYFVVFQIVLRLIFIFGHRVKFDKNGHKLPKQFLVLCNHASNWDGIYLNVFLRKFVYFIMHDEIYKYKLTRFAAYNILGQIKRGQVKNDLKWLRQIRDAAEGGNCVGIFPEGDISYTGTTLDIDDSIVKLCKILKLPIVMARIDGETFRWPRWSVRARKSPFSITVTDIADAEYVKNSSNDQLYSRILSGISYNDEQLRRRGLVHVRGKRQAEKLERLLFMCPDCKSYTALKSSKNSFFCTACGYMTHFSSGTFTLIRGNNLYDNIFDWDNFQRENLDDILNDGKNSGIQIFLQTNMDCYQAAQNGHFYRPHSRGMLVLYYNKLKYVQQDGTHSDFAVSEIRNIYIQFKGTLDFSVEDKRYRFKAVHDEHFGYVYQCLIQRIQQLMLEEAVLLPTKLVDKKTDTGAQIKTGTAKNAGGKRASA